jgi:hypothetical protein
VPPAASPRPPCASPRHRCGHWYNSSPPAAQISAAGPPLVPEFRKCPSAHPPPRLKSTRIDSAKMPPPIYRPPVLITCQHSNNKSNPMSGHEAKNNPSRATRQLRSSESRSERTRSRTQQRDLVGEKDGRKGRLEEGRL